jgi:tryptophanyl-tRNA synthetase
MSLSEQVLIMKNNLAEVEEHLNKLQTGRKSSSSKARSSLMKLKKDSHTLRSDIMKFTKELPTKKRTKKEAVQSPEEPVEAEPEEEPEAVKKPKSRKPRVKKVVVE